MSTSTKPLTYAPRNGRAVLVGPGPDTSRPRNVATLFDVLRERWAVGHVYDTAERMRLEDINVVPSPECWDLMQLDQRPALVWVSPELMALVVRVANTVPDDFAFDVDAAPFKRALVMFGSSCVGVDAKSPDEWVSIDGTLWGPIRMRIARDVPAIAVSSYTITHSQFPDVWAPLGRSEWLSTEPVGQVAMFAGRGGQNDNYTRSAVEDRRLLVALWQLMEMDRAVETTTYEPRGKSSKRSKRPTPRVVVLNLHGRHKPTESPVDVADDDETTRYRHRWWVDPYPRWQPYGPGNSLRRLQLIPGHMKGPDGAPFIDRARVWKLA